MPPKSNHNPLEGNVFSLIMSGDAVPARKTDALAQALVQDVTPTAHHESLEELYAFMENLQSERERLPQVPSVGLAASFLNKIVNMLRDTQNPDEIGERLEKMTEARKIDDLGDAIDNERQSFDDNANGRRYLRDIYALLSSACTQAVDVMGNAGDVAGCDAVGIMNAEIKKIKAGLEMELATLNSLTKQNDRLADKFIEACFAGAPPDVDIVDPSMTKDVLELDRRLGEMNALASIVSDPALTAEQRHETLVRGLLADAGHADERHVADLTALLEHMDVQCHLAALDLYHEVDSGFKNPQEGFIKTGEAVDDYLSATSLLRETYELLLSACTEASRRLGPSEGASAIDGAAETIRGAIGSLSAGIVVAGELKDRNNQQALDFIDRAAGKANRPFGKPPSGPA